MKDKIALLLYDLALDLWSCFDIAEIGYLFIFIYKNLAIFFISNTGNGRLVY